MASYIWSPTSPTSSNHYVRDDDDVGNSGSLRDRNRTLSNENNEDIEKSVFLTKRKDFLGVDEEADIQRHRTYYYKKTFDPDKVIRR